MKLMIKVGGGGGSASLVGFTKTTGYRHLTGQVRPPPLPILTSYLASSFHHRYPPPPPPPPPPSTFPRNSLPFLPPRNQRHPSSNRSDTKNKRLLSTTHSHQRPILHIRSSTHTMSNKVDFEQTVGYDNGDQPVSWNRRDLLLYSVGIGAGPDDLDYVYEASNDFRAFPTYPLVLGLKGEGQDTTVFSDMVGSRSALPGFPRLDPNTIVHGEQSIQILKPIPLVSGQGWKLKKRVCGVHDKPSGLILETEVNLISPVGHVHATMIGSAFYRGGGQGTGYSKSIVSKQQPSKSASTAAANRTPDLRISERTTPSQAILYRLSGDYNPLHVDPEIGRKGGLGGVILHGLCSYGHAARAVLKAVEPKDGRPDSSTKPELEFISARFTSPVRPGDELETSVWILGESGDQLVEVAFEQTVKGGKKSLGGGYARIKRKSGRGNPSPSKL
ncbi:hypothetical protein IE53DRAFT_388397 [Violaceomyces palustris]|uniref:Uncharacterized protein n=1 Tax=Violaceomyces palustris TaxID=1673888 RepID=A0ACD0NU76_9BASI|nr:hypothetical protein IE53DRAFT_388397 [Violaceomyces palustris]